MRARRPFSREPCDAHRAFAGFRAIVHERVIPIERRPFPDDVAPVGELESRCRYDGHEIPTERRPFADHSLRYVSYAFTTPSTERFEPCKRQFYSTELL